MFSIYFGKDQIKNPISVLKIPGSNIPFIVQGDLEFITAKKYRRAGG
jgi:hypothetical protein